MNRIFYYIFGLLLLPGFAGCDKFLEESSQNDVRPATTGDLAELMTGETYPQGSTFHNWLEILTDDVESRFTVPDVSPAIVNRWAPVFTWDIEMFEKLETTGAAGASGARIDTYDHYYRRIMSCNLVMDMLGKVRGSDAEKANLRGQALGMRAWYYFMLVNLFAEPYNAEGIDVETEPGVALVLSSVAYDEGPARSSLAAVYRRIESDLKEALPLIRQYGQNNNKYKVTETFIYTLLSRMYLYMENWEEAANYATLGLDNNPNLLKFSDFVTGTPSTMQGGVYGFDSPEAIWFGYGVQGINQEFACYDWAATGATYSPRSYTASQSLLDMYETSTVNTNYEDLRYFFYYYKRTSYITPNTFASLITFGNKYGSIAASQSGTVKGMRVAELYLNRAEAYAHMAGHGQDALDDLDFLRGHRYDTRNVAYTPLTAENQEQIIRLCRDERRRELSFEDHRWFDIRRYGKPGITHFIQLTELGTPAEYALEQGDSRYVLPIPREAWDSNDNLSGPLAPEEI